MTPELSVQSSYKLTLPSHLLIHASNIKLLESVGQGNLDVHDFSYSLATWSDHSMWHIGEFGIVYRGHIIKYQGTGQVVTDTVAIKTLKGINYRGVESIWLVGRGHTKSGGLRLCLL